MPKLYKITIPGPLGDRRPFPSPPQGVCRCNSLRVQTAHHQLHELVDAEKYPTEAFSLCLRSLQPK
jgi:hypothetical protein